MAENKKSFIAYVDWGETFNALPDEKAGQLVKHLFNYVNDKNPQTDDILINAVFANIKQQLKRDLQQWKSICVKRSESGKLGGRPKKQSKAKKANGFLEKQSKAKKADTDTVNDIDTVIVNDKEEKKINYAEFVSMFESEYKKLTDKHGEKNTIILIDILNNYKGSKGVKYKSDYLTILNWVIDRAKKDGKYEQKPKFVF
jgi:hypothetical protein